MSGTGQHAFLSTLQVLQLMWALLQSLTTEVAQEWPEMLQEGMGMAMRDGGLPKANRGQAKAGLEEKENKSGALSVYLPVQRPRGKRLKESCVVTGACNLGAQGSAGEVLRQENSKEFKASLRYNEILSENT